MDSQALDSRKQNTTTNTVVQYNRKFQHQETIFGRKSQQKFRSNVWRMIVVLYLWDAVNQKIRSPNIQNGLLYTPAYLANNF